MPDLKTKVSLAMRKRVSLTLFFLLALLQIVFVTGSGFAGVAPAKTATFTGVVQNSLTRRPIPNSQVIASNSKSITLASVTTDSRGRYTLSLSPLPRERISIKAEAQGYLPQTRVTSILILSRTYTLNFTLIPQQDTIQPTGSIKINNDSLYTNNLKVSLILSARDNPRGSGLAQMQFSSNGAAWSAFEDYSTTKAWTLPSGDGLKRVYVRFKDKAGNISLTYSDTIILDNTAPTTPTVTDDGRYTAFRNQLHAR